MSGSFSLPEAPASSMSNIPEHANIGREALAEEYELLQLPPLAVTPGRPLAWEQSLHSSVAIANFQMPVSGRGMGDTSSMSRNICCFLEDPCQPQIL